MKAVSKLVVMLSLGSLVSVAAFASTVEQTYLENCRKDPSIPVPVAVVSPSVGPEYGGSQLELEFVVDQKGKPANVSVKSAPDETVATAVADAVKQWKFKPAERDGIPVATKVVLPVKIIESPVSGAAFAAN
jgi:TonB family protein